MRRQVVTLACLGAALMFGGGCDDDEIDVPPGQQPPEEPPPGEPPPIPARRVEMIATEFRFDPAVVTALPGERLVIVLFNAGSDLHSLEVELPDREIELDPELLPGEIGELELTAPTILGDFEYYCPMSNHRALGMEGTLVVTRD